MQQQGSGADPGEAAKRPPQESYQQRRSQTKENRQPMLAAFSGEDSNVSSQQQPQDRQPLSGKLARPLAAEPKASNQFAKEPPPHQSTQPCGGGEPLPARLDGTECDNSDPAAASARKNDLEQKQTARAQVAGRELRQRDDRVRQENYCKNDNNYSSSSISNTSKQQRPALTKHDNQQDKQVEQQQQQAEGDDDGSKERTESGGQKEGEDHFDGNKAEKDEEDAEDDDDNQVIPSWPSKSDAHFQGRSHGFIQHKVYSLKDYSQVASPIGTTSTMAASQAFHKQQQLESNLSATRQQQQQRLLAAQLVSDKLFKSLSQERKIKANAKRMSECFHQPQQAGAGHSPSGPGASPSGSFSLGPSDGLQAQAGAGHAVLATTSAARQSSAAASLMGESRIDRMRKLFVSPLSLRSSAGGGHPAAAGGPSNKSSAAASAAPRLSLQPSSAMLNKKPTNQLMHAVYRGDGHHSRRSPMRQTKGKGFRVYGCPLQLANNIYPITCFGRADIYKQQSVPFVLARLCNYIEENSSQLTHEGIFRVSGNARLMEKLRTLFDHLGDAPLESESVDVATSASMLKMYLRELPEPLIPARMNYYFIALAKKYSPILAKETIQGGVGGSQVSTATAAAAAGGEQQQPESQAQSERLRLAFARDLTKLVRKLPIENYNLLKYLACFLYRVSMKQQYNKMCPEALGIVFGPNVFRIRSESYKGLKEQELSNQIMASIIRNYKSIFDSELTDPLGNPVACSGDNDSNQQQMAIAAANARAAATVTSTTFEPTVAISLAGADKISIGANLVAAPRSTGQEQSTQQLAGEVASSQAAAAAVVATKAESASAVGSGGQLPTCPSPSTSKAKLAPSLKRPTCCPELCRDYLFDDDDDVGGRASEPGADEEDDEDEEEEEDGIDESEEGDEEDDEHEDDDCDEGESYTPSSGSGSYCSSMDSETLESSYDEAGQERNVDLASRSNVSSSECGSDTSYTPTSSHTDSEPNDADASFYGNSSSFESSPSFARRRQAPQRAAPRGVSSEREHQQSNSQQQSSCLVCKRRQSSAQIAEAAGILSAEAAAADSAAICDSRTATVVTSDSKSNDNEPSRIVNETETNENELPQPRSQTTTAAATAFPLVELAASGTNQAGESQPAASGCAGSAAHKSQQQQLCPPTRSSGRKKRLANSGASSSTRRQQQQPQHSAAPRLVGDEQQQQQQEACSNRSARHSSGRHASKLDFMRRRSSSASSLSRVKHKQEQLVLAAQRKVSPKAAKSEETPKVRAVAPGGGGLDRRLAGASAGGRLHTAETQSARPRSSARRARGKSSSSSSASHHHHHLARRTPGADQQQFAGESSSSSRQRARTLHGLGSHGARLPARKAGGNASLSQAQQPSKADEAPTGGRLLKSAAAAAAVTFGVQTDRMLPDASLARKTDSGDEPEGAEELAARCWETLSAQYLEDELDCDDNDKFFLLRPFNSDETLLRSANYYSSEFSDLPLSSVAKTVDSVGESAEQRGGICSHVSSALVFGRPPRWQRRFSGHELDSENLVRAVHKQHQERGPCQRILLEFGDQDDESAKRALASPGKAIQDYDDDEDGIQSFDAAPKQQQVGSDFDCSHSASPCTLLGANASFVSLLENKLDNLNFNVDSELSLHHQAAGELSGAAAGGEGHSADDSPPADPIQSQMNTMKELLRALRKLAHTLPRLAVPFKWSSDGQDESKLESLVLRLTSEPSPDEANLSYSDDFSACSVDQLAAKSLVEQLEQQLLAFDDEQGASSSPSSCSVSEQPEQVERSPSSGETERLVKLLASKIAAFKQRYKDLKGIRQHYLKSHVRRAVGGCGDSSLAASASLGNSTPATLAETEGRSAKSETLHGGLDSICPCGGRRVDESQEAKAALSTAESPVTQMSPSPLGSQQRKMSEPNGAEQAPNSTSVSSSGALQTTEASTTQVPGRQSSRCSIGKATTEGAATTSCLQAATAATTAAAAGQEPSGDLQLATLSSGCRQISTRCKFGSLCPVEFVFNIEKLLAAKRAAGSRSIKLNEMNVDQLQSEKLELQKNLLRYEHWFGRPTTRLDFSLVGHLYERYRAVKMIKSRKNQQAAADN